MTIYYAGTSLADLNGSIGCVVTTRATFIDTTYVREGIQLALGSAGQVRIDFTALSEGWIHWKHYFAAIVNNASTQNYEILKLFSTAFSTSTSLFKVVYTAGATNSNGGYGYGVLNYWNGASYTAVNSETFVGISGAGAGVTIDVHFKLHDTLGYFVYYINGVEIFRYDGDTIRTAATTIDRIDIGGTNSVIVNYASEIIVADEDTRGMRLVSLAPTGNGGNTAWTGAFGDVDETGTDDTDYITSVSANDIETYTAGDIAGGLAGYDVLAVVVSARARRGTAGPQNLQAALRIASTNYFSSNISTLGNGYAPQQGIWTQDPNTTANWTQAAVNGMEFGLKSIT